MEQLSMDKFEGIPIEDQGSVLVIENKPKTEQAVKEIPEPANPIPGERWGPRCMNAICRRPIHRMSSGGKKILGLRGLCTECYQSARKLIRAKRVTDSQLVKNKKMLPISKTKRRYAPRGRIAWFLSDLK